jgi:solute carrier family 39 (zinc transporter), member 9
MQDLLIFSGASPLVAVASYLLLRQAASLGDNSASVALSVLFSAGTFLYAACVHLLPNASNLNAARLATLTLAAAVPCIFNSVGLHHH